MRIVYVDLSSDINTNSLFGGYEGEHKATLLTVKLPNRMIGNNIDYYKFCFETASGEYIESDGISASVLCDGELSLKLPRQVTVKGNLVVTVAGYSEVADETNGEVSLELIEKSSVVTLVIRNSASGSPAEYSDSEQSNTVWEFANVDGISYTSSQNLTDNQKAIARTNIGALGSGDVDETMSENSTNPVQNRIAKAYIDNLIGNADDLLIMLLEGENT